MAKFARVVNGIVDNIKESAPDFDWNPHSKELPLDFNWNPHSENLAPDPDWSTPTEHPTVHLVVEVSNIPCEVGWKYADGIFTPSK